MLAERKHLLGAAVDVKAPDSQAARSLLHGRLKIASRLEPSPADLPMLSDCPLTHLDAPRMRRNDFYDALTRHCFRILCRVPRRAGRPFGLRPLWALVLGLMERGVAKQANV
ncbi:hypothetical protein AOLI_G00115200 [Acnodon oligacanthus]